MCVIFHNCCFGFFEKNLRRKKENRYPCFKNVIKALSFKNYCKIGLLQMTLDLWEGYKNSNYSFDTA